MTYRFAVVEDVGTENDLFAGFLRDMYPGCIVDQYLEFLPAQDAVSHIEYDLVVSDINLGGGIGAWGGFAIAKALDSRKTPIIIVSALPQGELLNGIAMAVGAWDYLGKPVDEKEFRLQVQHAMAYRTDPINPYKGICASQEAASVVDPNLVIDMSRANVTWMGRRIPLSLTHIRILSLLLAQRDVPVSYDQIYAVIPSGRNKENLRVHIMSIRDAFRRVDPSFDSIATVTMYGYRWRV